MAYLANKTSGKPSFRMNRDLRTVQGMDYVRQLRGLRVLKFLDNKTCDPVQDWSFVLDLETYVWPLYEATPVTNYCHPS